MSPLKHTLVATLSLGAPVFASAAAEPAEGEAKEMPFLLSVDLGSAIWNLVVFLLLLTLLAKFVWPAISQGLKARDEKMRSDLEGAEKANKEAQDTLAQYKTQLAEAQKEYQRVVEEAKKDAQQAAAKVKADAEAELAGLKDRAAADIRAAKEQALADIYDQAAGLATDVAGKVLQREINAGEHQALVQESLSKLN